MRVGTLCFATTRGLGYLAKSFYDNGIVTDFAILHHGRLETHTEWYPGALQITRKPFLCDELKEFILHMDVMLFFETPFDWDILDFCKQNGVKTAIISMYECTPKQRKYEPDQWWCPSELDMDYFTERGVRVYIPSDGVTWRERNTATTFVHNAGHIGLKGRNGTEQLMLALPYVQSDAKFVIRCQDTNGFDRMIRRHPEIIGNQNVTLVREGVPRSEIWATGDVALQPEKWNGMSYPLQEAYASGLLVMTTKRYPMTEWLPEDPMIKVQATRTQSVAGYCYDFEESLLDPIDIADTVDEWYGRDITSYSLLGKQWARENSWHVLKPGYKQLLEELVG